jgi:NIMA (never in mitosis gene a)-related kinase
MSRLGIGGTVKDFVIQKFLGQGSFGAVYKVKRKSDGKIYAMKQVNTRKMSQKDREVAVNEIRILASTKNQYIIKFYEAFVHDQMLYIITEYAANGDVFQRLKRMKQKRQSMPEDVVWVFFIQLCLGIQALHRNNILHRDLKSANVFLSNHNCIKIGDLGVAKLLAASRAMAKTQIGTPYYVSPELWKNKPYNAKSDVWALGCLLYEMVMGKPPFESANMRGLAKKCMRGAYPAVSSRYSAELQGVIKKLLAVNPDNRPSIDQILQMDTVVSKMSLLPEAEVETPGTAQSEKETMIRTIRVPRKLRDLTAVKNFPGPRYEAEQAPGGKIHRVDPKFAS